MDSHGPPDYFAGDLGDPWIAAIAEAMPRGTIRVDAPGGWPDDWTSQARKARVVVLHAPILSASDADRLRTLREGGRDGEGGPPKVVVCVGPHVRAADLVRCAGWIDVVLPEATAVETIARHATGPAPSRSLLKFRPRVAVVGGSFEARRMNVEACERAGFPARAFVGWDQATPGGLAIWDVPVLEPGWERVLREEAAGRSILALIGFADRRTVAAARAAGAAACLDVPCDLDDLAFCLDRLALRHAKAAPHPVPPPPMRTRSARMRSVSDPRRSG